MQAQRPLGDSAPRVQLLFVLAAASALAYATWQALLNNFSVEHAGFDGAQIGALHSAREVPGFLAFTAVWVLLVLSQQRFALLALALLGALAGGMYQDQAGAVDWYLGNIGRVHAAGFPGQSRGSKIGYVAKRIERTPKASPVSARG